MGTNNGGARCVGDWVITQNIGAGSFAVVWKARHAITGQVVAIKEISTDKLNKKLRQSLETEVSILKQITHRNIVQLLEVIEEKGRMFLIMEYCSGGDMARFIRRQKRIPEATARALLRQLSAGLRELWSRNLVHRDLKPQNLLLSTNEAGEKLLKIADFGFARSLQPQGLAETLCGSPLYMAPEILQFHKYDAKADLWSVGTILFELVVGKPPFNGANHVALLRAIERQEAQVPEPIRKSLSSACISLLHGLLRRNPVERLTFEEFFSHPFLRSGSRSSSSQSGSRHSSQSSSITSSAEPSPMKPADRDTQAQPVSGARQVSMPAASPEDTLPFLLDEDPSRGSKHVSQDGSSAHGQMAMPLPQLQQPAQQLQPSLQQPQDQQALLQQRRAWSVDPQQAMQAQQFSFSPAQAQSRPPSVSERSHSLGAQHLYKPPASNPFLISTERQHGTSYPLRSSSGRSAGAPAFMPATPKQPLPPGMGDLLDEEEDYVIIEGVSPFSSAHANLPRRSTLPATQPIPSSLALAGTPPLYRGSPYSRSLPESSQSSQMQCYGSSPQGALCMSSASVTSPVSAGALSVSTFSSGVSRLELLVRAARILEGLAASKHAGGAPQDALALRLLTIQVLKEVVKIAPDEDSRVQSSLPDKALTAQRIVMEVRLLAGRCEESATAAAEGMDDCEELPDCWQLIYKAALALAKAAAVDELLGNTVTSMRAYHKAGSLLYFMCEEAPSMELSPALCLQSPERQRLKKYTADIFARYCAVSAGGVASPQHIRPLHLSVARPQAIQGRYRITC